MTSEFDFKGRPSQGGPEVISEKTPESFALRVDKMIDRIQVKRRAGYIAEKLLERAIQAEANDVPDLARVFVDLAELGLTGEDLRVYGITLDPNFVATSRVFPGLSKAELAWLAEDESRNPYDYDGDKKALDWLGENDNAPGIGSERATETTPIGLEHKGVFGDPIEIVQGLPLEKVDASEGHSPPSDWVADEGSDLPADVGIHSGEGDDAGEVIEDLHYSPELDPGLDLLPPLDTEEGQMSSSDVVYEAEVDSDEGAALDTKSTDVEGIVPEGEAQPLFDKVLDFLDDGNRTIDGRVVRNAVRQLVVDSDENPIVNRQFQNLFFRTVQNLNKRKVSLDIEGERQFTTYSPTSLATIVEEMAKSDNFKIVFPAEAKKK